MTQSNISDLGQQSGISRGSGPITQLRRKRILYIVDIHMSLGVYPIGVGNGRGGGGGGGGGGGSVSNGVEQVAFSRCTLYPKGHRKQK